MKHPSLALFLVAGLIGCATDSGGGDDGGDNGFEELGPFTNGVSTLTGSAHAGFEDGIRGEARFANPVNVAYGPDGKVYVADFDNGKIRVVDATSGETTTLFSQKNFMRPFAMAFAGNTMYVTTDWGPGAPETDRGPMAGTLWRVDLGSKTPEVVAPLIGKPRGLAVLPNGKLAVADYQHHVIQLVDPASGLVTPLAGAWDVKGMVDGPGAEALFSTPYGMVFANGKLIVADFDNNRIRAVGLDGTVETIAGDGTAGFADGTMGSAQFSRPQGVSLASNGDVFVTDLGNFRIRKIAGDRVETVAGSGKGGHLDSDDRLGAEIYGLEGLSVKPDGTTLFLADGGRGEAVPYNYIRSIKLN